MTNHLPITPAALTAARDRFYISDGGRPVYPATPRPSAEIIEEAGLTDLFAEADAAADKAAAAVADARAKRRASNLAQKDERVMTAEKDALLIAASDAERAARPLTTAAGTAEARALAAFLAGQTDSAKAAHARRALAAHEEAEAALDALLGAIERRERAYTLAGSPRVKVKQDGLIYAAVDTRAIRLESNGRNVHTVVADVRELVDAFPIEPTRDLAEQAPAPTQTKKGGRK